MISADVARGDAEDQSAFHIFDIDDFQQVADFRGKIDTTRYATMLKNIGNEYNQAMLVVQGNNMGQSVVRMLLQYTYPNIFYTDKNQENLNPYKSTQYSNDIRRQIPGFFTTSKNKPLMIQKIQLLIINHEIILHSKRLMNEFDTYVWLPNGKTSSISNKYSDHLIMALAIGT